MLKIELESGKYPDNFLVYMISKEQAKKPSQKKLCSSSEIANYVKESKFEGEKGETEVLSPQLKPLKRICLVGIGEEKKADKEAFRVASANALKAARGYKYKEYSVQLPCYEKLNLPGSVQAVTEGTLLADYEFDKYRKKDPKKDPPKIKRVVLLPYKDKKIGEVKNRLKETVKVCESVYLVRDLVNENAALATPLYIEKLAKQVAKKSKLRIKVLTERDMKKLGMNLILGVNRGSEIPPRIIILEHNGNKRSKKKLLLIGKGITFDTGGLNLKPTNYIESMKSDMAGAATVLGIMKTASDLKIKQNIVGIMGCTENAIGAKAQKPGDVLKSYEGKFVEIGNTDAEGRLVMGDCIAYGIKKYKPEFGIDLATLTGSVIQALGTHAAGVVTTKDKLFKDLKKAEDETFERVWQFPLYEEYKEDIKSDIADIQNISKTHHAGHITAGAFLIEFTGKTPWMHIDIAGTAYNEKTGKVYTQKGATGYGVRLIIEYLKNLKL